MKAKLTVRSVEAMQPDERDVILWDTELAGFGCKLTPAGKRTYFLYYRTKEGQQRRPAIGQHGAIKPEAARAIASAWLAEVAKGADPSLTRKLGRTAPSVADLCERYLSEHADTRKKARSAAGDRSIIRRHLLPALGSKKVAAVARPDIASLHHRLRATPYEANRMLALASKMFALAERWGMRPDNSNPAKNIDRFKEQKRQRYLSSAEIARLWEALDSQAAAAQVQPNAIAAIKLLILTGRRLNEVLGLKWAWVDLDAKLLRLPDTKGGALTVSLNEAACDLLASLRARDGIHPYVIPGSLPGKSLVNLQKPWSKLRKLAELEDVRLHDLRHTFASIGAGMGMSLPLLGRLLGHSQAATTSRYAHLAQNPVREAADTIGAEIIRLSKRRS